MTIKKHIASFLSIAVLAFIPISVQAQQSAFKAAFLYHFTEYISWGSVKMETFNFAVLEDSPVTKQMQTIAGDKKIKNKPIIVTEYNNLGTVEDCQILFVPSNSSTPLESILAKYAGKPTLIVTEKDGYGKKGAHINFLITDNRLRFEINLKAFKSSGIEVSSQLLQHALIIE